MSLNKKLDPLIEKAIKYHLKDLEGQTEELCLAAVKDDGHLLEYVKNQTEEICLIAVKEFGYSLQKVQNQTPLICLEALKSTASVLRHVKIVKYQNLEDCIQKLENKLKLTKLIN